MTDSETLDLVGNTLTLSYWVKRQGVRGETLLKKADSSHGYQLTVTATGTLQFEIRLAGTSKTVTSTTTIPLNQWKHVAAWYDGSAVRVFINGTIDTAATGALTATTEPLFLGGDTTHLNGTLDEVSIFDSALTDAEITNLTNNRAGRYEYHHQNALGSNIVLTDGKKNVLARYEYDVFGAVRSETGTSTNVRKFTGKEWEEDVKLYYYSARYYDPYIGRFTQRDPIGQGVNWYAYAMNNPLAFIDPTGLVPRPLSPLEASAVNLGLSGAVDPGELLIDVVPNTGNRGESKGNGLIVINQALYDQAGLDANSTVENTDVLDPAVIDVLSTLIHEATHYWQGKYKRHQYFKVARGEEARYYFSAPELLRVDLAQEQHAAAVQVYFILAWQLHHGAETISINAFNGHNDTDYVGPIDRFTLLGQRMMGGTTLSRSGARGWLGFFAPLMTEIRFPATT